MGNPWMDTFINSEDPNEMPYYATFNLGQHCYGKKKNQTKNIFLLLKL